MTEELEPLTEERREHCLQVAKEVITVGGMLWQTTTYDICQIAVEQEAELGRLRKLEQAARVHRDRREVWIESSTWAGAEFESMMEAADALNEALADLDSATGEQA